MGSSLLVFCPLCQLVQLILAKPCVFSLGLADLPDSPGSQLPHSFLFPLLPASTSSHQFTPISTSLVRLNWWWCFSGQDAAPLSWLTHRLVTAAIPPCVGSVPQELSSLVGRCSRPSNCSAACWACRPSTPIFKKTPALRWALCCGLSGTLLSLRIQVCLKWRKTAYWYVWHLVWLSTLWSKCICVFPSQ